MPDSHLQVSFPAKLRGLACSLTPAYEGAQEEKQVEQKGGGFPAFPVVGQLNILRVR